MNILKVLGGIIVVAFKAITGKKDDVMVQLPANIAITTEQIDQCLHIVDQVQAVVDSPLTIVLTDLVPGTIDNAIRQKISEAIPAIITGLTFINKAIHSTATDDIKVGVGLAKVRLSDDPDKDAFYHALAARLIMVASDGKVTWSEAVSILEVYFKNVFKIKN